MKALLAIILAACSYASVVEAATIGTKAEATAPMAVDPAPAEGLAGIRAKVIAHADAAIARANAYIANPKTTDAERVYAQKRVACYTAIKEIVPNVNLPDLPSIDKPNGPLDFFELGAENVEHIANQDGGDLLLSDVDKAKFVTNCGWIGQRARGIAAVLGLRVVALGKGMAFLAPK